MANLDAGRGKEAVSRVKPLRRGDGRRLRLGIVMRGQSVALLGVEHGVALHVGDFPLGLLSLRVGLGAG